MDAVALELEASLGDIRKAQTRVAEAETVAQHIADEFCPNLAEVKGDVVERSAEFVPQALGVAVQLAELLDEAQARLEAGQAAAAREAQAARRLRELLGLYHEELLRAAEATAAMPRPPEPRAEIEPHGSLEQRLQAARAEGLVMRERLAALSEARAARKSSAASSSQVRTGAGAAVRHGRGGAVQAGDFFSMLETVLMGSASSTRVASRQSMAGLSPEVASLSESVSQGLEYVGRLASSGADARDAAVSSTSYPLRPLISTRDPSMRIKPMMKFSAREPFASERSLSLEATTSSPQLQMPSQHEFADRALLSHERASSSSTFPLAVAERTSELHSHLAYSEFADRPELRAIGFDDSRHGRFQQGKSHPSSSRPSSSRTKHGCGGDVGFDMWGLPSSYL